MISFGAWKKPFSTRRFQNHWNGRKEKIRTHSDLKMSSDDMFLAPQVGLEPTTLRLTAECSAIELLRNKFRRRPNLPGRVQPSTFGAKRLNYCVRNGNRWNPLAITTGNCLLFNPHTLKITQPSFATQEISFLPAHFLFLGLSFLVSARSSPRPISINNLHALLRFQR